MMRVPSDFPVKPLRRNSRAYREAMTSRTACTCGSCGRTWDDSIVTGWTPAPSARCPFEYFHGKAS